MLLHKENVLDTNIFLCNILPKTMGLYPSSTCSIDLPKKRIIVVNKLRTGFHNVYSCGQPPVSSVKEFTGVFF